MKLAKQASRRQRAIERATQRSIVRLFPLPLLESLESRRLLSADPAHITAYTPLVIDNAGSTLTAPFNPSQIRQAYGINQIHFGATSGDGTGQTIAIIDAFNDPNIATDANNFSSHFGLPLFNTGGPTLSILNQNGSTSNLPANASINGADGSEWDVEESLDVEYAHTVAPGANLVLFEANSSNFNDLFTAIDTARNLPSVTEVSMSFSGGEFNGEQNFDFHFTTPTGHVGESFVASTGDGSFPGGYPAVAQNVVAVGGTSLTINSDGSYGGESAWSGGGGNISDFETQPVFQNRVASAYSTTQRLSPDVSWIADPQTGVSVLDSYSNTSNGGYETIGGTSLATPMWAGLISIVNQGRAIQGKTSLDGGSQILPLLYNLPSTDFHDITTGGNGYPAQPGYDIATGLGTPVPTSLVADLTADNVVFVDKQAPGPLNNGSSWNNAFTSLPAALSAATAGETIVVAQGTYLPTSGADRTATFQLQSGVALDGGFAGSSALNRDASGVGFNTILSGDIGTFGVNSDNSYHVLTGSGADATAVLDGFTITGGNANGVATGQDDGGGIFIAAGNPTLADCTFSNNVAADQGGAAFAASSSSSIFNCTFDSNSTINPSGDGGALFLSGSSPSLKNCRFTNNSVAASGSGGAVANSAFSSPTFVNCDFVNNSGGLSGGAFYNANASANLSDCTLTGNSATSGAAMLSVFSTITLANDILWGDSGAEIAGSLSTVSASFCDIQGGFTGTLILNTNPMFIDPAHLNVQLQQGSPCIDAGNNALVPANVGTDLAGAARIDGITVDLGAFESPFLYVDAGASGTGSGGTWQNAFTNLPAALIASQWGQTIDVAGGTYTPTTGTDRTATFALFDNIPLYGGFAGHNLSNPFARNTDLYPSILSGAIGVPGSGAPASYHVVSIPTNVSSNTVLDGFTITGGNADGSGNGNSSFGGGIFESSGSPTINNCIITANTANGQAAGDGFGGGMFDFQAVPTISNCTFIANTTEGDFSYGAGLFDYLAQPTLINCTFTNNIDNGQNCLGGGLFGFMAGEQIIGCLFQNNAANNQGFGGGIFNFTSSPLIVNSVFVGNQANSPNTFGGGFGGGMYNYSGSTPTIDNCTFTQNTANIGGGIFSNSNSPATITNTILWNDSSFFNNEFFANDSASAPTISYDDINQDGFTGTNIINADPQFLNPSALAAGQPAGLSLQLFSPCVNTGNNADIPDGIITDITGGPRVVGPAVDMGAYEFSTSVNWTGAGDGHNWSDPNNWSTDQVPGLNDFVTIAAGFPVVDVSGGAFVAGAISASSPLEIRGNSSLEMLGNAGTAATTIDSGGTLIVDYTLAADAISDAGSLAITSQNLGYFFNVSGSGAVQIINGAIVTLSGNDTYTGGTFIDSTSALTVTALNQLPQNQPVANNGTLQINAGTAAQPVIFGNSAGPDLTGSGTLLIGQSGVATGSLRLAVNGPSPTLVSTAASTMAGLVINTGSTFDITNNKVVINFGGAPDPLSTLRGYLHSAYNNGNWLGVTGLTSSIVQAQVAANKGSTNGLYSIGYADGNDDGSIGGASPGQFIISPQLVADANQDGKVDFNDLLILSQNNGSTTADWAHADFNFDGKVDFNDLLLFAQNVNKTNGNTPLAAQLPASASVAQPTATQIAPTLQLPAIVSVNQLFSSVPITLASDNAAISILHSQMDGDLLGSL